MPASTATKGYGSILAHATTFAGTYTAIAQTVDLAGPEPEVGDINVTNNDSPSNTKEYIPGMIEPGEQDFEVIYKKAEAAILAGMLGDGIVYFWRETYPDGSKWEYPAYMKKIGTEAPTEDGAIRNSITLKLTSKPVFTPGP